MFVTAALLIVREPPLVFAEPATPKIGVILPLSGPLASLGEKVRQGIVLAGEVEGLPPESIVFEDGEFSNSKAVSAFTKLSSVDHIDGLVGPFGPGQTAAVSRLAEANKVPLIAISLCDQSFPRTPLAWCSYLSPPDQAEPVLERFRTAPLKEKIARVGSLIEEVQGFDDYHDLVKRFATESPRNFVADERFAGGTKDFRALLVKMKNQNVDLLTIAAVDPNIAVIILRQAADLHLKPPVRWLMTERDDQVFAASPELFHDIWYLSLADIDDSFRDHLRRRFGTEADIYPALGFDATRSLVSVLRRADGRGGVDFAEKLLSLRLKNTAFQDFRFDRERGVRMRSRVASFNHGKVEYPERELPGG